MRSTGDPAKALRPEAAFVLQLEPLAERVAGRVEHVATGRAAWFRSVDELLAFIRRTLDGPCAPNRSEEEPER